MERDEERWREICSDGVRFREIDRDGQRWIQI